MIDMLFLSQNLFSSPTLFVGNRCPFSRSILSLGAMVLFSMVVLSGSESATTVAAATDTRGGNNNQHTQEPSCGCFDEWDFLGAATSGGTHIDVQDGDDPCGVYWSSPSFGLNRNGTYLFSDLAYSLTPNGLEALYREGSSRPRVSIPIDGNLVEYETKGFRILVPSEHTLGGTVFAAEIQIVHTVVAMEAEEAPSVLVSGVWIIDSETVNDPRNIDAASRASFGEILAEWQTKVEMLEASCNAARIASTTEPPESVSSDGFAAPAVVGRGDEQTFANNPIRHRRTEVNTNGFLVLYDWWQQSLNSSSFYAYETKACKDVISSSCSNNSTVLWYLSGSPVEISHEHIATMRALLEQHKDETNCEPFSSLEVLSKNNNSSNNHSAQTQNNAEVLRVCFVGSSGKVAIPSPTFSFVLAIFAPMAAALIL